MSFQSFILGHRFFLTRNDSLMFWTFSTLLFPHFCLSSASHISFPLIILISAFKSFISCLIRTKFQKRLDQSLCQAPFVSRGVSERIKITTKREQLVFFDLSLISARPQPRPPRRRRGGDERVLEHFNTLTHSRIPLPLPLPIHFVFTRAKIYR